ncbi:MAG TPA: PQQ-binding-like beta-propeller repeat protein, partial [Gemmatales bacterium]|nr:PQQ-binding-like beta-propeller repeat protein [Gemmatales bacterium]
MMNAPRPWQRLLLAVLATGTMVGLGLLATAAPEPAGEAAPANGPRSGLAGRAGFRESTWPMFGGTLHRNMANDRETGMPTEWDVEAGKNIKWFVELGSQSYGNPVFARGRIYLGTNNGTPRNPKHQGDKGILMCFEEADGKFIWQAVHDKLEAGRVNDWPEQGICSSPFVEGDRLYYVSNRCELVCATLDGLGAGNQGMKDEKYQEPIDVDMIWSLDMMKELGVFPHNLAVCSPIVVGDLIFVLTGNGHDESHENIPAPQAPSFIAVNKHTGKVVWTSNAPGSRVLHGQWSNPCYGVIANRPQVIFAGGDGWVRSYEPQTGKEIWRFDCNPKSAVYKLGGKGTKNYIIGTPVVWDNKVYINSGQDPEHGDGVGHLWCIDPAKAGDGFEVDLSPVNDNFDPADPVNKNSGLVWHHGGVDAKGDLIWRRSLSTACIHEGLLYMCNLPGF